jgi:hypothetical protein
MTREDVTTDEFVRKLCERNPEQQRDDFENFVSYLHGVLVEHRLRLSKSDWANRELMLIRGDPRWSPSNADRLTPRQLHLIGLVHEEINRMAPVGK